MSRAVQSRVWVGLTISWLVGCVELSGPEGTNSSPDGIDVAPPSTPDAEVDDDIDDAGQAFLDAGSAPEPSDLVDAALSTDAAQPDTDTQDASTPKGPTPPTDAGVVKPDAGVVKPDAGTPVPDAGAPKPDGGTPVPDGGTPVPDAGTVKPDPGTAIPAVPTEFVTFTRVYTIIRAGCRSICHVPGTAYGLDMSTQARAYAALVGGPKMGASEWVSCENKGHFRVIPFHPDLSLLIQKLEWTHTCGTEMPPGQTMAPALIQEIRDWIAGGALDN